MNQTNLFYLKKCVTVLAGSQKTQLNELQRCLAAATRTQTKMGF